jgi:predicted HTH transcriptional regulator
MQREESGTLEFKLRIDSQQKIAKTLVAFANGEGGRIAIGVRDNGSVAGCNVEEEFHMVEGAAQRFTRPEVPCTAQQERWDGKLVLVVTVPPSLVRPHEAQIEGTEHWLAFVRRGAANFKANRVLLEAMSLRSREAVQASEFQLDLLKLLGQNPLSASALARASKLPIREVEDGLAVLLHWGQIQASPVEQGWRYLSVCE